LARAALDSAVVRAAVGAPRRWRELALATPVEGMVLEGFIDLLYETDAGLVLVDYKTDHLSGDPEEESAAIAHYELQLAAYAAALEAILGRPVARAVLLFVGSGSAREVNVSDLAGAVAHVRTVLSAESNRLDQLLATATTSG
jgi:ATP-dependent helicase/nuclease subunit A